MENEIDNDYKIHTDDGNGYEFFNLGKFRINYVNGVPVKGIMIGDKEWDLQNDRGLPKEFNELAIKIYNGREKLIQKGYWTERDLEYMLDQKSARPSPLGGRSKKAMDIMNMVLNDYMK